MFSNLKIIKLAEIDSTNDYAKEILHSQKELLPFMVQASYQTKGKGQYTKFWYSDNAKNLLCSLAFQIQNIRIEEQFVISQIIAVSLYKVLQDYQLTAAIKWPNDIYVENKKIAGILIENSIISSRIESVIVGLGFNLNQTNFPKDLRNKATSLSLITKKEFDIDEFVKKWIEKLQWAFSENKEEIKEIYHTRLYQKDKFAHYKDAKNEFDGKILGVDNRGQLILQTLDGTVKYYMNNELLYL